MVDAANPQKRLLNGVTLTVRRGEIVGIFGLLVAGRSELLLTLFGAPPGIVVSGEVRLDGQPVRFRSPIDAIKAGVGLSRKTERRRG